MAVESRQVGGGLLDFIEKLLVPEPAHSGDRDRSQGPGLLEGKRERTAFV